MDIFRHIIAIAIAVIFIPNVTYAFDLLVKVKELESDEGSVCLTLISEKEAKSFPSGSNHSQKECVPANKKGVEYKFTNLVPGYYAVSTFHDTDNTRVLERNSFGLPLKAWGVSNNERPVFSAPKFDKSKILLDDNKVIEIECVLRKGKK